MSMASTGFPFVHNIAHPYRKAELTIWLISVMGIGEMVLSDPCGSEEALGVGETPGEAGCTFTTLSFDVRLGDSLAGKLSVFVHCDRLRTIFIVHKHKTRSLNTIDTSDTTAHHDGW